MKIISCERCGVLLDTDRIQEPRIYDGQDQLIEENILYRYGGYTPAVDCPVCKTKISLEDGGE